MTAVQTEAKAIRKQTPGAWLLPTFAIFFGGGFGERHAMEGLAALSVLAVGFVTGVLWQLLHRRDLADRFSLFALFVLVGAVFLATVPSGYLLANSGPGHALAGVMAGAVLTERALRRLK